jgi:hypothetical protein
MSVLSAFLVILPADDDDNWLVRINNEPHHWTGPRASRSFVEGEQLVPTDLVVAQIDAPPGEPERFISGIWNGEAWVLVAAEPSASAACGAP